MKELRYAKSFRSGACTKNSGMDCCKGRFARCGDIVTEGRETPVICRAQLINWNVFCCQYDHILNLCRCLHRRIYYINDLSISFQY